MTEKTTPSGTEPGQRRLNGPQTTGRTYRNLSEPQHGTVTELDTQVTVRDGTVLVADVLRPDTDDPVPALIAASCYPRQIQNSGAPLGFVEAGASDFWVPRGYGHVLANVRGTGGSGGTYTWLDETERQDMADLVEWTAAQPWCDGNVGMIGISYFAMTQLAAAIERPPHLRAIFPVATTADVYEAVWHNGVLSTTFASAWIAGVGILADKGDELFRNKVVGVAEHLLKSKRVHEKFEHLNGEAAISSLSEVMRAHYDRSFDELWTDVVSHPTRGAFWDSRNMAALAERIDVPVYLGCDWENVPLHLPSTFVLWKALAGRVPARMGMLGKNGLTWPWESLHVEALAWFDHWLKDADTGILDGPPVRYWLPGADEFREADTWPPTGTTTVELALRADGSLARDEGTAGHRRYEFLAPTVLRPKGAPTPALPDRLVWDTEVLAADVDVVGELEIVLDATTTALDTAWMVTVQDVAADEIEDITAGWLRASLRTIDDAASHPGAPVLPLDRAVAVDPGTMTRYRIPLCPNARRFQRGHRIRVILTSNDQSDDAPAMMKFRHAPVGDAAIHTIASSSRLVLPVLGGGAALP